MNPLAHLTPLAPLALASAALAQPCTPAWQGFSLDDEASALFSDAANPAAPDLLVGGRFSSPAFLARVAGTTLAPVAPGLDGEILGIARHDDGSGSTLYVTGAPNMPIAGGWPVPYARLEAGAFRSFGPPTGPGTWTGPAISYNLGLGPKLLTSGGFGSPCEYVTQWNGSGWECLGSGLGSVVRQGVLFDDGSGTALFLVGSFVVNDIPSFESFGLAKWTGTRWETVGHGIGGGGGACCAVFDDGSGPELFVGGVFSRVGAAPGLPASNIAKWNGRRWATLAGGTDRVVSALAPFDDGSGLKLYAAGDFTQAGGTPVQRLARWDGSAWSPCPAGGLPSGTVNAMIAHDPDGPGPEPAQLVLAGAFTAVGGGAVPAANLAILHAARNPADFNHDGFTDFFDYDDYVGAFEHGDPAADVNADGFLDFFDYDDFVTAFESGC